MKCDYCNSTKLTLGYKVDSSRMNARIFVCTNCGLTQSVYSSSINPRGRLSVSSGADFGNIRYGKGFSTAKHCALLDKYIDWPSVHNVLDIGSNRGSFINAAYSKGDFSVYAIEPDTIVSPDYKDLPRVELFKGKIEKANLSGKKFDLIYSSHTFEHLDSFTKVLGQIAEAAKVGTYLLAEVPDLRYILQPDIIEEWFIDAHTFHFSRKIFKQYLKRFGWEIIYENPSGEVDVFTVLAKYSGKPVKDIGKVSSVITKEAKSALLNLKKYKKSLDNNSKIAKKVARIIESFYPKKIAIWGAGRIYNACVSKGSLDLAKIGALIDSYLPKYIPSVYGQKLLYPKDARLSEYDVLVLMTRDYRDEVHKEALKLGFTGYITDYSSLWRKAAKSKTHEKKTSAKTKSSRH